MRIEYISSSPVWLRSGWDSYLACAYVARDYSTKCIALADAFSPIIETRVDVEAPLDGTSCKGLEISDAPVTTKGSIELWRAGVQLVVLQGGVLHSLNAWLTTLDRAAMLVKRFEDLDTIVPRIKCNTFSDVVAQLTNAPTVKRSKTVPWQAEVDIDRALFVIGIPRYVDTRPGYLFAFLPHSAPVFIEVPPEPIDSPPRNVAPPPPRVVPCVALPPPPRVVPLLQVSIVDSVAYHEQHGWTANTSDIPVDSLSTSDLIALYEESIRQFRARTPVGVLNNIQCCMCWKPSNSLCTGCSMFSLCTECAVKLEGNCDACLFEGQENTADECIRRRE